MNPSTRHVTWPLETVRAHGHNGRMIIRSNVRTAALLSAVLLSACVGAPVRPTPEPPSVVASPPPPPVQPAKSWEDWPVATGDWSYRSEGGNSIASFGQAGQAPLLSFRCQRATRQIAVERGTLQPSAQGGQMTVHTSFGVSQWPLDAFAVTPPGTARAGATRAAVDPVFDRISFSRGRFAIEVPGTTPVALPNWPEISRVIEDCRG